ncbi:MAG: RNA-binding transcriptional accessory protein [bacterium]|nr:MAG: RNA-binding transcriptional accessory protein [bacterium]
MIEKDFYRLIAEEMNLKAFQVANTIELLDTGNTVPFIARYRKEATGKLDEDQIRTIEDRIRYLRMLQERKETILKSIHEQGKLTPELETRIKISLKLQEIEDLYLPYRPKKRTRATIAREKGLEPLAQLILAQEITTGTVSEFAAPYIDEEKSVKNGEEAIAGALDIIAEIISDNADTRKLVRETTRNKGILASIAKDPEKKSEYELYYDFKEPVKRIVPHRILAINRGEKEECLRVSIDVEENQIIPDLYQQFIHGQSIFKALMEQAIKDAYKRLIAPSIERELRNELTEAADHHAIRVFATNLRQLLLQPPIKGKTILGIDPGFRTGCKVAVIDETGKYLEGETIYPHPPQNEVFESKTIIRRLIDTHDVDLIAIGNGTASRETELLIVELMNEIKQTGKKEIYYTIINEAGASVYSASKIAQREFPDLEASMRGNISIARRLMDPLAELVKIDPKSIGVGLYQHDVNQKKLSDTLSAVVESAVNLVGVDLNTASVSLLQYISGLNARTAENIVKYRDKNGKFKNRQELTGVSGLGEVAFQQAAGFLRIPDGDNPLDNTSIHPESYKATQNLLKKFKILDKPASWKTIRINLNLKEMVLSDLAASLNLGEPTLQDIISNLEKPGRDPREEMPQPTLRSDILKIEDLREGMILQGTVRNVVDFGAFVDVGLKRDGLVHVSELGEGFIKNPHKVVSVGDIISVKVIGIDLDRERIKLSLKQSKS